MTDYLKIVVTAGAIGGLAAGVFALPSVLPAAMAQEQPIRAVLGAAASDFFGTPFDTDSLVKYDVTFDKSVSTDVKKTQVVKKIAHGQVEIVTIVTTPSGTYSSDALTSPNVLYPGIEVTVKPEYRVLQELADRYGVRGLVPLYNNSFVVLLLPENA